VLYNAALKTVNEGGPQPSAGEAERFQPMPIRPARSPAKALLLAAALAVAACAQAALSGTALAQEGEDADEVVARVNGEEITRSEVVQVIETLPEQYRQVPTDVLIPAIAEQMAIGREIERRAEEAGLADEPEVRQRLEQARMNILQEVWLDRRIDERITEDAIRQAYEAFLEANPPAEEVKARHILLENEEEADAVIAELEAGAEFGELARERSVGPSGEAGGDLGWFREGQMVEPFGEVAFALEPGSYTEDPVETQFGWHVILVDDRRTVEPPSLEDVRGRLETQLGQRIAQEVVQDVRADADIELLGAAAEGAAPEGGAAEEGPSPAMETGDGTAGPDDGAEAPAVQ
jgi:peptidyl-prolyl cis-trans isomerase C